MDYAMSLLEERRALNCFPVTGEICHIPGIEAFGAHLEQTLLFHGVATSLTI
jgi:hypothetical protein